MASGVNGGPVMSVARTLRNNGRIVSASVLVIWVLIAKLPDYNPLWATGSIGGAIANDKKNFSEEKFIVPPLPPLTGASATQKPSMTEFRNRCEKRGPYMEKIYKQVDADVEIFSNMNETRKREYERWCHRLGELEPSKISSAMPQWAQCIAVSIRDNRIFIKANYRAEQSRHHAILLMLYRLSAKVALPDVDFTLTVHDGWDDTGGLPVFMTGRKPHLRNQSLLYPDYNHMTWPESTCPGEATHAWSAMFAHYKTLYNKFQKDKVGFVSNKKRDIFWRGDDAAGLRIPYVDKVNSVTSIGPKYKNAVDVRIMHWHKTTLQGNSASGCVTLPEHCDHRFLLNLDGTNWSNRFKGLFSCGSVVFQPKPVCYEWYFYGLPNITEANEDNEIIIWLNSQATDFKEKFIPLYDHEPTNPNDRIVKIVERAFKFSMEVLNEDSMDCYFGRLIDNAAKTWGPLGDSVGRPLEDVLLTPNQKFSVLGDSTTVTKKKQDPSRLAGALLGNEAGV